MEKTYRFIPHFNPAWLMVAILGVVALALLGTLKTNDMPGIAAGILVLVFAGLSFYRSNRGLQRAMDRKLVLGEKGLRYEINGQAYTMDWGQCDHRVERIDRDTEVSTVTLVTRGNEWLTLSRFENMREILMSIRQHVPASGARGLAETILLKYRWPGLLLAGLLALGAMIFVCQKDIPELSADQTQLLAYVLIAPCVIAGLYISSRSPLLKLARAVQQRDSGSAVRRFFINFAVWVAIVVVVLLILNFWVPRH